MRFCQFDDLVTGALTVGVRAHSGRILPLHRLLSIYGAAGTEARVATMLEVIESWDAGVLSLGLLGDHLASLTVESETHLGALEVDAVHLRAPITTPPKFFAVAINGKSNWERAVKPIAATPHYFIKLRTCLTGPNDPIEIPNIGSVGPEVELALVIGRRGKHIMAADAHQFVFGYTIHNDLTAHDLRVRSEWIKLRRKDGSEEHLTYPGRWKNFDTFSPLGPWLVTADEVPNPDTLDLWARLNGQLVQQGNTRDYVFKAPQLIEYISAAHTLEPGDLLSLGTVPAVDPWTMASIDLRRYGGVIEVGIEGLGKLRNPIQPV